MTSSFFFGSRFLTQDFIIRRFNISRPIRGSTATSPFFKAKILFMNGSSVGEGWYKLTGAIQKSCHQVGEGGGDLTNADSNVERSIRGSLFVLIMGDVKNT